MLWLLQMHIQKYKCIQWPQLFDCIEFERRLEFLQYATIQPNFESIIVILQALPRKKNLQKEASLIMIWLFKIDNNLIIESSISTNLPSGVSASYGIHFLNCSVEEWTAYHFSHAPMNSNTMGTFMMVLCYRLKLFFCFHDWERLTMIAQYHRQIRVKHFEWITDLNFATKFSYIVPLRNNSQSFFLDDFVGKRKCCKDFHSQLSKLHSFSSSCFFSIFLQISNSLNPWTISLSLSCIFIVRMGYIDLGLTQLILLFYWVITTKLRNSQNAPVLQ